MSKEKKYRKVTETIEKVAKNKDGDIKGKGKVKLYSEDKKGHDEAIKDIGYAELIWHYNRQAASQELNLNRKEVDEFVKVEKEAKATHKRLDEDNKSNMEKEMIALKEKYAAIATAGSK